MQINFTGRHIEVTQALKEFTTEKFQKLEKRLKNITNVSVIFLLDNTNHIAEATVHAAPKNEVHAKAEAVDMYAAVDILVDKLLAQITKLKEKMTDHR